MDEVTIQRTIALAFVFLGLFLLVDQIDVLLGLGIGTAVRALILLAGIISLVAGLILFRDSSKGQ